MSDDIDKMQKSDRELGEFMTGLNLATVKLGSSPKEEPLEGESASISNLQKVLLRVLVMRELGTVERAFSKLVKEILENENLPPSPPGL